VISRGGRIELSAHLAAGRVTVFEFYADWCSVCRRIDAGLRQLMRTRHDVTLKKINIGDGETEVAKQYRIEITPTFHVYSAGGRLVKVFSGGDLGELEKAIREAATEQEK
jgi:thiol-disulfide isomerase/thioredoxin